MGLIFVGVVYIGVMIVLVIKGIEWFCKGGEGWRWF
jgi:hypothetical protein